MNPTEKERTQDHFARPAGGFTTATKPYVCVVCGRPCEPKRSVSQGGKGKRGAWVHSLGH